jgi:hypothetical protein
MQDGFDPNWTEEEARAATDVSTDWPWDTRIGWHLTPLRKWRKWWDAVYLEKEYNDGNVLALFRAIDICLDFKISPPVWCLVPFKRAVAELANGQHMTLDEAFGSPYPKGAHRSKYGNHFTKAYALHRDITELKEKYGDSLALDDGLFEVVGGWHGVKKTKAKELYYAHQAHLKKWELARSLRPRKT